MLVAFFFLFFLGSNSVSNYLQHIWAKGTSEALGDQTQFYDIDNTQGIQFHISLIISASLLSQRKENHHLLLWEACEAVGQAGSTRTLRELRSSNQFHRGTRNNLCPSPPGPVGPALLQVAQTAALVERWISCFLNHIKKKTPSVIKNHSKASAFTWLQGYSALQKQLHWCDGGELSVTLLVLVVNTIILMFAEEAWFFSPLFSCPDLFFKEILILLWSPVKYRTQRILTRCNSFSKASRIKNCNAFLILKAKCQRVSHVEQARPAFHCLTYRWCIQKKAITLPAGKRSTFWFQLLFHGWECHRTEAQTNKFKHKDYFPVSSSNTRSHV